MTVKFAFVDVETTGLDPTVHEVWEVALIVCEQTAGGLTETFRRNWFLPVLRLGNADATALKVGGFYDRYPQPTGPTVTALHVFADEFSRATVDARLVGSNPAFDQSFLAPLLRRNGACPSWHYQLIDVRTLAVGGLHGNGYPHASQHTAMDLAGWKSHDLFRAIGVSADDFATHTAMGDAELAKAVYETVTR